MRTRNLILLALGLAGALLLVPELLPSGPSTSLDANRFLQGGQFAIAAGVIFLGGFLTSLTPCVYPLIPITVSVFGARKAESRLEAVGLTTAYIVGMGVVFSLLGVLAALAGEAFGTALGNPVVVLFIAAFLLLLSSSMFGAFELALPSSVATRLTSVGGGGFLGAFLMGSVSGFLAAPCTGPVLSGVLTFVAQSQNVVLGGGLLFIYALGIGVPFFLIGVFTVRLPKSGVWMEWIKSVFGIALVALSLAYVRDAWPLLREFLRRVGAFLGQWPLAGMAALLLGLGVLLGAIHLSFKERLSQGLLKGLGVLLVSAAVLLRTSASHAPEAGELFVRLGWQKAPKPAELWAMTFPPSSAPVANADALDSALKSAREESKPVMIDFFAEWCEACKELDRFTYSDARVREELKRFVSIKLDSTDSNDVTEGLWERFRIQGLPTVVFIDSTGKVMESPRVLGFVEAEEFLKEIRKVP